jgi:hypothetical protein
MGQSPWKRAGNQSGRAKVGGGYHRAIIDPSRFTASARVPLCGLLPGPHHGL